MKNGVNQLDKNAVTQPRTLFKPASWLAKIDFINHLILFNNVLITILSEEQGGKSCFGTVLQNNLDSQIKAVSLSVSVPCDRQAIINDISEKLNLNSDDATDINGIVAQINERKAHVLLLIDEAQHLPEAFIKEAMVAIKNQENFGFFHLCLISDYSVVATLNKLAIDYFNNLIHTIELGSLNESETRTYVLQRAMTEGLINRPLSDQQFKQFYQQTKGNLAKINSSLESFIFNCATQKKNSKLVTPKRISVAISSALVAGVSYLYFDSLSPKFQTTNSVSVDASSAALPAINPAEQAPLLSQIPSWLDSSTHQLVENALPKKQILDDLDDDQVNTVAIVDKVIVIPRVKAALPKLQAQSQEKASPGAKQIQLSSVKQAKIINKQPTVAVANKYTIQLAASHKKEEVHRFKHSNKLFENAKVRHFTNAKGTWYVLTLGEYSSRGQAQTDANNLPAELAKLNPWIRPVSGLSLIG